MNELLKYIQRFQKNKKRGAGKFFLLVVLMIITSACANIETIDSTGLGENTTQDFSEMQAMKREQALLEKDKETEGLVEKQEIKPTENERVAQEIKGKLKVHYINVGQGDSTLIQLPNGKTVLIDGATRSNGQTVLDYLNQLNIEKIDYLIATHPHEDHIGGLVNVVKQFEIGKIYMPDKAHTTIVFEDLLLAIKEKSYSITKAKAGDILFEEEGLTMNVLAPSGMSGSNLNNYSVANRLVFGNTAFVFTGDAEQKSEKNMVESGYELKADVLKVGHHGGDTSSISSFLSAVNADYGIISAGIDNQYGHPHANVMNRLADHGVKTFRTDQDGTIIASSDGKTIEFNQVATAIVKGPADFRDPNGADEQVEVYRTDTGSKYHRADCHTLKHSKVAIPLSDAKKEGLEACGICKPRK